MGTSKLENYARAIRAIYSTTSLANIAYWAKRCEKGELGDKEFSAIQRKIVEGHLAGFSFDFLTTSIINCDQNLAPVEANVVCLDIDASLATGYAEVAHYDEVSPLAYINSGKLVRSEKLRTLDEWRNHPIYQQHCKYYDIDKGLTISFQSPERHRTFLAFEYLASSDPHDWDKVDAHYLELATFPFALAWYFRKGMMDEAALERRFLAISDLTETQLTHIRKYVNSPDKSFREQSTDLNISEAWLKESMYEARKQLSSRMDWLTNSNRATVSLRQLESEFSFFKMLGDPSADLRVFSTQF